jgi:hypothetical protein
MFRGQKDTKKNQHLLPVKTPVLGKYLGYKSRNYDKNKSNSFE